MNYYFIDVYKLPNFPSERNFGKSQCEINYFFSHSRIFPLNCHWDYFVTRVKKSVNISETMKLMLKNLYNKQDN
jgi:hypothetical protein